MRAVQLGLVVALAVVAAGCGGRSDVDEYAAEHWPTFPSEEDPLTVAWPEGKLDHCVESERVVGNYACYYKDDDGNDGYVCLTTEFDYEGPDGYDVIVAVSPEDPRVWTDDAGTPQPPKRVC